jgi:hypothetical protein
MRADKLDRLMQITMHVLGVKTLRMTLLYFAYLEAMER